MELDALTALFNTLEQYGRGVNLDIHGIEDTGHDSDVMIVEKTALALDVSYSVSEIQTVHRIPTRSPSGQSGPPFFLVVR